MSRGGQTSTEPTLPGILPRSGEGEVVGDNRQNRMFETGTMTSGIKKGETTQSGGMKINHRTISRISILPTRISRIVITVRMESADCGDIRLMRTTYRSGPLKICLKLEAVRLIATAPTTECIRTRKMRTREETETTTTPPILPTTIIPCPPRHNTVPIPPANILRTFPLHETLTMPLP
uniref:Uncharacterized protein n=1 Tax=Cacopsylla melanoneura TaxID=428564 RepID=A0A8D8Y684_9HEMI